MRSIKVCITGRIKQPSLLRLFARAAELIERRAAIARAIADASPADIVLLAGKGHETWQEIAGVRWPCDDAAEARRALAAREDRS